MHFTPTSASWPNMVKCFFRNLTSERLRRGVFSSVPELVAAINDYVGHHNTDPKPFICTRSARDILQKAIRADRRLRGLQTERNTALVRLRRAAQRRGLSAALRFGLWASDTSRSVAVRSAQSWQRQVAPQPPFSATLRNTSTTNDVLQSVHARTLWAVGPSSLGGRPHWDSFIDLRTRS